MSVIQAAHRFGSHSGPVVFPVAPSSLQVVPAPVVGETAALDKLIKSFVRARRMTTTGDAYYRDIVGPPAWNPDRAMPYVGFLASRGVSFFEATREDVNDWRLYMAEAGLAPSTRARRLAAVHGLYTHGVVENFPGVTENPAANVPRPMVGSNVQYSGLESGDVARLLRVVESSAYRQVDRNWLRTAAIINVLTYTGIRRGELCGATLDHLGTQRGHSTLQVVRKGGRTQTIVLPPRPDAVLRQYLDGRTTGSLVESEDGNPLHESGIFRAVQRLGRVALPQVESLHPHDMRHSCATMLFELGTSARVVQAILGHADPRTTERYDHARQMLDESPQYLLEGMLAVAGGEYEQVDRSL